MYKQIGIGQQANCFCKPPPVIKFYMRYSLFLQYFILIKYMYVLHNISAIKEESYVRCNLCRYDYFLWYGNIWIHPSEVFRDLDLRKRRRYISSVRKHNIVLMFTCTFINDLFLATKTPNYICNNEWNAKWILYSLKNKLFMLM